MMQAVRNNEANPLFYAEFFRFEVALLKKMVDRRNILAGAKDLDFVEEPDAKKDTPAPLADTNILKIVLKTISEKFGKTHYRIFHALWKDIVKDSFLKDFDPEFYASVKSALQTQKSRLVFEHAKVKLECSSTDP